MKNEKQQDWRAWALYGASQPCPSGHITVDKKLRYASPKLPSATSFIRKTLGKITAIKLRRMGI